MSISKADIRPFAQSEEIQLIRLRDGLFSADILTLGGILRALRVPDKTGTLRDVVLGYDRAEDYYTHGQYFGAIIGRYANRIAGGQFTLNGVTRTLCKNDGANHLHGGAHGFNAHIWQIEKADESSVTLFMTSPDGEEGYPGKLDLHVTYRLDGGALSIRYDAVSDQDTVFNPTNHAYFNLGGHDACSILSHTLRLEADFFTPANAGLIPCGELKTVESTAFDFRKDMPIGLHIEDDDPQLRMAGGYDHNFVLRGNHGTPRSSGLLSCPETGITMEVLTTMPGIQVYTDNVASPRLGKEGVCYGPHHAICLETQFYPDSPNKPAFPSPILSAGVPCRYETIYRFGLKA